jgi:hypothetical protein
MNDELEPLSPEVERLLEAERQRPGFSAQAHERILARLESSATAPAPIGGTLGRVPLVALGFALGLAVGAGGAAGLLRAPRPLLLPARPEVERASERVTTVNVRTEVVPLRATATAVPQIRALSLGDSRDRDLAAERGLVDRARAAVGRSQPAAALEALEQHRQRFPRGRLAEERDSLQVQALIQLGRFDHARARAAEFVRLYPHSLLTPAVEAALRSIPQGR